MNRSRVAPRSLRGPARPRGPAAGRSGLVALAALLWLGGAAALALGLGKLDAYVQATLPVGAATRLVWADAWPDWMREHPEWRTAIIQEVESRIFPAFGPRTQIYDPHVCAFVAERAGLSQWVERVRRVTKHADGRVLIDAEFRRPFAAVEQDGWCYVVDPRGTVLPSEPATPGEAVAAGWIVIRGAQRRVQSYGEVWPGDDVAAGLKLADAIYRTMGKELRGEIVAIDVSRFDPKVGGLRLATRNPQSYIIWGLAPGEEYGVEAAAGEKIGGLQTVFELHGNRLPDRGPIDIRPRGWVEFYTGRPTDTP